MADAVICTGDFAGLFWNLGGLSGPSLPIYVTFEVYVTSADLAAWYAANPSNFQLADVFTRGGSFSDQSMYLHDGGSAFDGWQTDESIHSGGSPLLGNLGDGWHTVAFSVVESGQPGFFSVDGNEVDDTSAYLLGSTAENVTFGASSGGVGTGDLWLGRLQVGTTKGGSDLLDYLPCRDGSPISFGFSANGDTANLGTAPTPPPSASECATPPIPPATIPYQSPPWRFVIGDLQTFETLSFLDRLASQKIVTLTLNQAASAEGVVPSDNPEINIPWPDTGDDPFLAEGSRVLWGFRKEGTLDAEPVWVIRFAGILQQLEDTAQSDVAYSHYTAFDPWQYLLSRPVCNADGSLPGPDGISFGATAVDVIALTLLKNTITNQGICGIDAGTSWGGTSFYAGTIESLDPIDINFAQGTSVGQAWKQLTDSDACDILLTPVYDPVNRPGYLVDFNIYAQAGAARDDAIFAWDMPSRSLVGLDRTYSGTERANVVKYFAGQGGSATGGQTIALQEDAASIAKFGEYWRQQFFPNQTVAAAVQALAQAQLQLSKDGRVTVVFSPAPERSPIPFQDYYLGDRVPVYASNALRAPIPDPSLPTSDQQNYQRIYGIPITIADDTTEQVQQMLTSIPAG